MEKIEEIDENNTHISQGFFVELNCGICMDDEKEKSYGASTKEELFKEISDDGWKHLDSDIYGCIGWWCGCDYMD